MTLDIVIVNWNGGTRLLDCLRSIESACDGVALNRVVVVDNASRDGSADRLDAGALPLAILRNQENRGFAAACNQGARGSEADYLLFLNPDTRLSRKSLGAPLAFMEEPENGRVGILGIQLVDDRGQVSRSCARFPTPGLFWNRLSGLDQLFPRHISSYFMSDWPHDESREVDHVIGAYFLVRRPVFDALGGFDEHFFVYLEDMDFSLRARRAGWRSYYLADVQAWHRGGGTSEQAKAARLFYSLRSRILYGHKHFRRGWALGLAFATLWLEPFPRLARAAVRVSGREVVETLHGYLMLWREMAELLLGPRVRGG